MNADETPVPGGGRAEGAPAANPPHAGHADAADAFARALDGLVAAMPVEQARLLSLCALPRWLDRGLLGALLGEAEAVPAALALLRPLRLVSWEPDGRFRLHEAARQHLRRRLRAADPGTWQRANAAARAYFAGRAGGTVRAGGGSEAGEAGEAGGTGVTGEAGGTGVTGEAGGTARDAVEALYHQLAVDEAAGLAELERRFEAAVWQHQLGLAERFLLAATEQADDHSPVGQAWLRFYAARLDQLYRRGDLGAAVLEDLAAGSERPVPTTRGGAPETVPPGTTAGRLAAAAGLALARLDIDQRRWHSAVQRLRAAQTALGAGDKAAVDRARIALALGDTYRDLAARTVGFGPQSAESGGLWHRLRLAPFLALRGLARRRRRWPNWWWWHAGAGYPDWIVAWLLERAQHGYRQAEAGFTTAEGHGRLDAALALAETSRQLGRWAEARARFEDLLGDETLGQSPYGRARAELGLGAVLADQGERAAARRHLAAAREVFERFGDAAGSAAAELALGQVARAAGEADQAAATYAAAQPALAAAGDLLALSELAGRIDSLVEQGGLSPASLAAVEEARAAITEQHHLARCPGSLLLLFRRLALYLALPITFTLGTLALALALVIGGAVIETEWLLLRQGELGKIALADHVTLLATALGLALAALWLYPFVYGLFGMLLVRSLGRRLVPIEREQPALVVWGPAGLGLDEGRVEGARHLSWTEVGSALAADLRLRRRTLHLVSRTAVLSGTAGPLIVEGIVGRYEALHEGLRRHLVTPLQTFDVALLAPAWVAGTLAACLALVAWLDSLKLVPVIGAVGTRPGAGETIDLTLTLTMPLAYLFVTFVLGLTLVSHWRLVAQAHRLRRASGLTLGLVPAPLLVLAALAWTLLFALVVAAMVWFGQQLGPAA